MNQDSLYYRHSGTVGAAGIPLMLLLGLVGALVGGAVYGYLIFYIPIIYLNFFITLGFGALVGYIVGIGAKVGKVRNYAVVIAVAFFAGVLADYFGWVSWLHAATGREHLVLDPLALGSWMAAIAETGAWSVSTWSPKGWVLYAIWLMELVMIVSLAIKISLGRVSIPFCEACQKWTEVLPDSPKMKPTYEREELKARLEQADFTALAELGKAEQDARDFTELEISSCPGCTSSRFMTVKAVRITADEKGKDKKEEEALLEHLVLSPEAQSQLASPA